MALRSTIIDHISPQRPTCLFHRAVEGDMGVGCNDLCKLTLQVLQVSGEVGVVKKVAVKITLGSSPCSLSHSVCLSCRGATPALCGAAGLQNSRLSARSLPPSFTRSLPPASSLLLRSSVPVSCTHSVLSSLQRCVPPLSTLGWDLQTSSSR